MKGASDSEDTPPIQDIKSLSCHERSFGSLGWRPRREKKLQREERAQENALTFRQRLGVSLSKLGQREPDQVVAKLAQRGNAAALARLADQAFGRPTEAEQDARSDAGLAALTRDERAQLRAILEGPDPSSELVQQEGAQQTPSADGATDSDEVDGKRAGLEDESQSLCLTRALDVRDLGGGRGRVNPVGVVRVWCRRGLSPASETRSTCSASARAPSGGEDPEQETKRATGSPTPG